MTVLFSRKCEYALQGLLYLSQHQERGSISADEIAGDLDISKDFISKALQKLARAGIVKSTRGKSGGFRLNRDAQSISLMDVIDIIDGMDVFESCVLGLPECGADSPCPVHEQWGRIRASTRDLFESLSIIQMGGQAVNVGLNTATLSQLSEG